MDKSRVLAGSKNKYGARENKMTDENNGIAFAMTSEEENEIKGKKKEVTCYKCKKTAQYSNKCTEDETIKMSIKKDPTSLY